MSGSKVSFTSVSKIYSTNYAFLALDDAGNAQCWGLADYGGLP